MNRGPRLRSEKNCSGKNPFKACNQATVVRAVFGQVIEIEQLGSRLKVDSSALLFEGEWRHPDGDEPVLTVGQPELGMTEHLKEELSISSRVE